MPMRLLASLLAALAVLPAADVARGDEPTASLTVTVKDNYGVLPGASVRLVDEATQERRSAPSDAHGRAAFTGLPAGTYTLRAAVAGFADFTQSGITLAPGEARRLDAVLTLVQFSSSVTVTTANRREQLLLDVAEPTTLIDEAQILDTGGRTAKDLLIQEAGSGVQVNAGGGQGHVSINGIPNSGVLVLIDGRRFLGRDANGNFNLEEIQLAGIERIEVVKGPGSALYGADALGGVINFITRSGKERGARNTLGLLGGSYGDWRVNDTFTQRAARGGLSAYGSLRGYDGFDLDARNPQTIGQPQSRFKSVGLSGDVRLGAKVTARLFGDYNFRDIDNYFFSGATQLASTVYDSRRELTRTTLSPELEFTPDARTFVGATYTWGRYARDETRVFTLSGRVAPQPAWREWNREWKLVARRRFALGGRDHLVQAGYEHRSEKLRRGTLSVADPERDIDVAWAQVELDAGARLKLTGGFRRDDYSDFGARTSPKAGAVFTLHGAHRLRGSFGEGFRPPYFGELYLDTPPFFVGNPALRPEETRGFTAGYTYAGPRAQVSADWFHTRLRNGIVFDLRELPFTYGNLNEYTSRGVNLSAAVSLPAGFTPSLDYTHNRRADEEGDEIGGYPKNSLFAKLLWTNARLGLRANARVEWNGRVPPGSTDVSYQPSYQVWYAQVNKTFARKGRYAVSAFAQVSNLFDERDVYRRQTCGVPGVPAGCVEGRPLTNEVLQVWIAPRTFQAGVTIDADWTR
jgi:outer membrane cobalamin receptor